MTRPSPSVTVVTGAASGIGAAVARRLARPDGTLLLFDRAESVTDLAGELSGQGTPAESVVCDVGDAHALRDRLADIEERHGRCDVLVNNAGIHPRAADGSAFPITETPDDAWQAAMAVNLTAPFTLCRWALRLMSPHGWGRIVNISSMAARRYVPGVGAYYAATKAGLIGFTRVLAGEGGPCGVTANCIAPGKISTPFYAAANRPNPQDELRGIPLGRLGTADEIADVAAFLVTPQASYLTGAVLDVTGGMMG
ncbi:SDR family NAD(P)-dependent oxidoreductase [Saccharomonospora sp. NPDC046836]|uniref:SDR family NAD(P)-dependent oxidoreductase n=1 Tax=Saccharomonospora sp. NPDC046836 TaxID=3156921 RepID=UPI0034018A5E